MGKAFPLHGRVIPEEMVRSRLDPLELKIVEPFPELVNFLPDLFGGIPAP